MLITKIINKVYFKKDYLNYFLFLLLIFFLPSQLGKHFFFSFSYLNGIRVDYLAPTLYLTDVLIFFIFLFNFSHIYSFLKDKKLILVIGLFIINIFLSTNKYLAFYKFLKVFELIILFIVSGIFYKKINKKALLIVLIFSSLIQLFLSFYQFIYKQSAQGVFYFLGERRFSFSTIGIAKVFFDGKEFLRPYGSFSHPNSLGGFFLLLYVFILTNKNFNKNLIFKNIFLLISSLLILISFSKVAIFTFIIINLFYFIKKDGCKFCLLAKIVIFLTIGLIFLTSQTDILSLEKRFFLFKNSFLILSKYFFSGVGLGNYLLAQNQLKSIYPYFLNQPVHNIFLLFLNEVGIFIFLITIKYLVVFIRKNKINFYLILTILITGFFDHYWWSLQQNFLLLAFIYGSSSIDFFTSKLSFKRKFKSS